MEDLHHYWHLNRDELLSALGADPQRGLDSAAVAERQARHGPNALPEPEKRPAWRAFLQQFQSPLIYILFIAAIFAFALGERGDSVVILIVVFINSLIGWLQEGRAEREMEALRKLSGTQARVLRDGEEAVLDSGLLVPGDIILLAAGDAVCADARLLECAALEASEATLTGESLPVRKITQPLPLETLLADRTNMVYSGTHITAGRARAVVTATGPATEVGKIAHMTGSTERPKTPLELSIAQFGRYLVAGAVVMFIAVVVIGVARGIDIVEILMVAISQMVSMVPEGLPVAMTIALAVGMQRMAKRGAIVRRLAAVETLGSTSVICADKTGTLTRNEMTATALWLPLGRFVEVSGAGYAPQGNFHEGGEEIDVIGDRAIAMLLEAGSLCNDARLVPPDAADSRWRCLGDPTEGALQTLAMKGNVDPARLRQEWQRRAELPFDPDAGMMATSHSDPDDRVSRVMFKGAPEAILRFCAASAESGGIEPMDERRRVLVRKAAESLGGRALRVLAIARVDDAAIEPGDTFESFSGRLTLLGLVGEMDPPREEVRQSVKLCQQAGMRPVMVTGDHKATGLAVARMLGIARNDDLAVDGSELQLMEEQELNDRIDQIAVFARVHPAQKLRIIEALQARGEVVAMTGDGVNDAPALVRADVGVAMGITGTEVAKSVAEIVVTDDNFSTIVDAVEEGRLVHRNLRKVILYLFATSMAAILVLLAALLLGYPLPLAAVQILWINIVTEGTVTVNLIMEPPEGDEMQQRPVELHQPLLSGELLRRVALMTPMMAISTFGYFTWRLSQGVPYPQVQTETFTVLAVCQWFNVLNCQSATRSVFRLGVLRNRWMLGGLVVGVALQLMVIYWTPLNAIFHTTPISAADFLVMTIVASLVLWAEELRKLLAGLRRAAARV